ncbi:MAG: RNA polymerase sigma factor [Acidimicrobiales bacterium]
MAGRVDSPAWWAGATDLAGRAVAGDRQAAGDLAAHVRPWILRLAGTQFPYRGDAEDVAQNVSVAIIRRVDGLRDITRLRSWLATLTFNEVRTFYRRQQAESARLYRANGGRLPSEEAPERTSVLGGLRVDLLDGLERLPRAAAFALGLRQLGVGYAEIAAEMSTPERLEELFGSERGPVPEGTVNGGSRTPGTSCGTAWPTPEDRSGLPAAEYRPYAPPPWTIARPFPVATPGPDRDRSTVSGCSTCRRW